MRRKLFYFFFFTIISLLFFFNIINEKTQQLSKNYSNNKGFMTIENVEDITDSTIPIDGKWIQFIDGKPSYYTFLIDAKPQGISNNIVLQMKLIFPEKEKTYGVIIPGLGGNYTFAVNDKVIFTNENSEKNLLDNLKVHYFYLDTKEATLTLSTQNQFMINPVYPYLRIGYTDSAEKDYMLTLFKDLFFVIFFLTSSLYYFIITMSDQIKGKYITFYLLCISSAIRVSLTNSAIAGIILPNLNENISNIILRNTPSIMSLLIILHIRQLFPKYLKRLPVIINTCFSLMYSILAVFFYEQYKPIIMALFVISSIYSLLLIIITILQTIAHREKGYAMFTFAGIILIISTIIESYTINFKAPFGYTLTIGFTIFVFLHAILFFEQTKYDKDKELRTSQKYNKALADLHYEETNFLSSHLKPHFLFNALNIISGYAIYDSSKSKNLTKALSIYLKQLFEHDNLNEMNTVSNEIDLVKAFGLIESERFPDITITYNINYQHNILIPSLILQPLLENSVNHGIRKKKHLKGTIKVSVIEENNFIFFSIIDDGVGFENQDAINNAVSEPHDTKYHSLYHLKFKLKELYDEELIIKNFDEEGTYIKFKIPIKNASE